MALGKELSSDTYNDENFEKVVTTVDDKSITAENHGEQINNSFRYPISNNWGVTGSIIEVDGVLYVHKCLHCEYYYESCEIYGDTDETTTVLAHSINLCSLCDSAPSFKDNPIVKSDDFNEWLLEENRQMAHQGLLGEYKVYEVYEADLEQAQQPLKPSIRPVTEDDGERMRKYFGYVLAQIVWNTYKYSNQDCVLPPSSRFQKRFKSPNPILNLHRRNATDATDHIFSDTPTMDDKKTSDSIYVGHDSKITDVYKVKDNSGKEFLGAM